MSNIYEWKSYKNIIVFFRKATRMIVSMEKSMFLHNSSDVEIYGNIRELFIFE